MTSPVQTDANAFYEGFSTREMIENVRRWLGVDPTDINRYSDAAVVQGLNYGQNRFAALTGCLLMPTVIMLKANRQSYRLPYNTLGVKAARFYTSDNASDYYELIIKNSTAQMQRINPSYRGDLGTPAYIFPSYRAGNVQMFGLSPIPTSDGTIWVGSDYGLLQTATGFEVAGNITGTHKDGYAASAFFVDSDGRDMVVLGALVGYPIFNVTDGSSGIITAIGDADATNDKVTATLVGGTNNYWSPGDTFQIPMGEYGVVMDVNGQETYTVSSWMGTIADIVGNTNNLVLDIARKPLSLSATLDTFISEIPDPYQEAVIAFGVYWLGRGAYKGVVQTQKATEGLALFNQYVAEYNQTDLFEESDKEIEDRSFEYLY